MKKLTNHVNGKPLNARNCVPVTSKHLSMLSMSQNAIKGSERWSERIVQALKGLLLVNFDKARVGIYLLERGNFAWSDSAEPLSDKAARVSPSRLILMATFQLHVKDFKALSAPQMLALPQHVCLKPSHLSHRFETVFWVSFGCEDEGKEEKKAPAPLKLETF